MFLKKNSVRDEIISMKSVLSNNDSFHTAYSDNIALQNSTPLSNISNSGNFTQSYDDLSIETKSDEIRSEGIIYI